MGEFSGKLVLVTGGGKNTGKAIVQHFARNGAHVIVNFFHSLEAAKQTKRELAEEGLEIDLIRASVAQKEQVEHLFHEIEERYGYLDILINNAAGGALVSNEEVTAEYLERAFAINVKGSFWCSRLAAPLMIRRGGGAIVNLSAYVGSQLVMAGYMANAPAKAGVEALTRYLAVELAPHNIRVNIASAGLIAGETANKFPRAAEQQAVIIAATPLKRLCQPEEYAEVVGFLASERARSITGQAILADGGISLGSAMFAPPGDYTPSFSLFPEPGGLLDVPSNVANEDSSSEEPLQEVMEQNREEVDEERIAIVGMGIAVAGASTPEEFWQVLMQGTNLLTPVPQDRWDARYLSSRDQYADEKRVEGIFNRQFQPTPMLAQEGDTRLSEYELTTLWLRHCLLQALEGVKQSGDDRYSLVIGYTPDGSQHLDEATILSGARVRMRELMQRMELPPVEAQELLAEVMETLSKRYWRGASNPVRFLPHQVGHQVIAGILPEETDVRIVDTACSSSLYAIDIAVKGLLLEKQDIAICGGAFALAPRLLQLFRKLGGTSVNGEVRALDQGGDGTLFADGAGIVVLKKLKRAIADGDPILALLRTGGCSSDGKGKAIYAPNAAGQTLALERAYSQSGVRPEEVDWVVAHATGTPVGDQVEFGVLRETFKGSHPIAVTSNKSLIGHTGWASGVVSLIEVILGLQKNQIPPQYRFTSAPQGFEIEHSLLTIPTTVRPWQKKGKHARMAAISSFGFGGTNAHLVVEEYQAGCCPAPTLKTSASTAERIALVGWSAHVPGLASRNEIEQWLTGTGRLPELSFGVSYPPPSFQKVRLPPALLRAVDRCQLMALECADQLRLQLPEVWEANREQTGIFLGHMAATNAAMLTASRCYLDDIVQALSANPQLTELSHFSLLLEQFQQEVKQLVPAMSEDSCPGVMPNIIPARVANYFNLHGPNMTIDTGFSSALTAFEVAERYLRTGEVTLALVGGINGNTTGEAHELLRNLLPTSECELAEGAFLFAVMTETQARQAGLPILGYIDSIGESKEGILATNTLAGSPTSERSYLGAEGALRVLRTLLQKDVAETLLQLQRYQPVLEAFECETVRPAVDFLAPASLVLTDQPALLMAGAVPLPPNAVIFSTTPLEGAVEGWHYLPEIHPEAVQNLMRCVGDSIQHVRILSDLKLSAPLPACLTAEPTSLLALHDLAFLVIQCLAERLQEGSISCQALFLNAMSDQCPHPLSGLFGGLMKCAQLELPDCPMYALFTDAVALKEGLQQARRESSARRTSATVFYQQHVRKTHFLCEAPAVLPKDIPAPLDETSVILALGGARGITAELLKALAQRFHSRIYIIGSTALEDDLEGLLTLSDEAFAKQRPAYIREQKALHPERGLGEINRGFEHEMKVRTMRKTLALLADDCGAEKVHYYSCDVMDGERLAQVVAGIVQAEGKIDLLLFAAGLNHPAPLSSKPWQHFRAVRDVKVRGYMHAKYALRHCSPRLWCNVGSIASLAGQIGEVDYSSANDFLSSAATYTNQVAGYEEFTMDWSLWSATGMGAGPLVSDHLKRLGVYSGMTTEEGIYHFMKEIHNPRHVPVTAYVGEAEKAFLSHALTPDFFREPSARLDVHRRETPFFLDQCPLHERDEAVFLHTFDETKDAYLYGHIVKGYPTLPGTFFTEIAAEAALQLLPDWQVVAFENLAFHRFIRLYGKGRTTATRIQAKVIERTDERVVVQVQILSDLFAPNGKLLAQDRLHCAMDVVLSQQFQPAPYWEKWQHFGEVALPNPYYHPTSPVQLNDVFVATTDEHCHPDGKRCRYVPNIPQDHAAFSRFVIPTMLFDSMLRVGVLTRLHDKYIPLAFPLSIRRIDLYEAVNDCQLSNSADALELYATPSGLVLSEADGPSRYVAVKADGTILAQIKDVAAQVAGYLDEESGECILPEQYEQLQMAQVGQIGQIGQERKEQC